MSDIFISYRRSDSSAITGRLFDQLTIEFGKERLFKDVDAIPVGKDFRSAIRHSVGRCKVLVAVIGQEWLDSRDEDTGARRLDDLNDYVRVELETALARGIPVVPVLADNAPMPPPSGLPKSLEQIAFLNAAKLRPDPDFHSDCKRLLKLLQSFMHDDEKHTLSSQVSPSVPKTEAGTSLNKSRTLQGIALQACCFILGIAVATGIQQFFASDTRHATDEAVAAGVVVTESTPRLHKLDLFQGQVYHEITGVSRRSALTLSGPATIRTIAAEPYEGWLHLAAVDSNGSVWLASWLDGHWNGWFKVPIPRPVRNVALAADQDDGTVNLISKLPDNGYEWFVLQPDGTWIRK